MHLIILSVINYSGNETCIITARIKRTSITDFDIRPHIGARNRLQAINLSRSILNIQTDIIISCVTQSGDVINHLGAVHVLRTIWIIYIYVLHG